MYIRALINNPLSRLQRKKDSVIHHIQQGVKTYI